MSAASETIPAPLKISRRVEIQPWLYLLPVILGLGLWVFAPMVRAFVLSFYEWNLLPTAPKNFVGLQNYTRLLSLPDMGRAVLNTVVYIAGLLPMSVVLPLAAAIFTQDLPSRSRNLYRSLIFVPMIIAPVVVAVVWRWLLDPNHGAFNLALQTLGTPPIGFLQDSRYAMATIIWITGWKLIGFSTLIFAAANANIDQSYVEAARLDGASEWAIIRDIRLPLLLPTTMFLTMMTVLLGAQWSFTYINVLTQGGPLKSTTNIYYVLWDYGFSNMTVGWSSAAGMMLLGAFAVLAVLLLRFSERKATYDN